MSELLAGFHKNDVTPKMGGLLLCGYGGPTRFGATVESPLECLVTAVRQDDLLLLFVNLDTLYIWNEHLLRWKNAVSSVTGAAPEHIFISATHTHSAPGTLDNDWSGALSEYLNQVETEMKDAAKRAVADLAPARLRYGSREVGDDKLRFNFIRYYTLTDMKYKDHPEDGPVYYAGDNFGMKYTRHMDQHFFSGHAEKADNEMQMLAFEREGRDSIYFINFQAHPTTTGGISETMISSDYPYTLRKHFEELVPNSKAVFIQGACGNINHNTRIEEEGIPGVTWFNYSDKKICFHHVYGTILATYAYMIHNKLQDSEDHTLKAMQEKIILKADHSMDGKKEQAIEVQQVFNTEGRTKAMWDLCDKYGFESPYEADCIISKSEAPETHECEINVVRLGDLAFVTTPSEPFNATGLFVKKNSPFKMTIFQGYSCGMLSYLPSKGSPMNSYERHRTTVELGSAELLAEHQIKMLNQLK